MPELTTIQTTDTKKTFPFHSTLPRNFQDTPDLDTFLESYQDYAEHCRKMSKKQS